MHRRCLSLVVEGCRDDGAGVRAIDDHAGILAREICQKLRPHATSRPHNTPPSAARLSPASTSPAPGRPRPPRSTTAASSSASTPRPGSWTTPTARAAGTCWTGVGLSGSTSPMRSIPRPSASTTAGRWWASTWTPPVASTGSCGSGGASQLSTPRRGRNLADRHQRPRPAPRRPGRVRRNRPRARPGAGPLHDLRTPGRRVRRPLRHQQPRPDRRLCLPRPRRHRGTGFLLAKGPRGAFTPINFPGAANTVVAGINNRGLIVGAYQNATAAPGPQQDSSSPVAMAPELLRGLLGDPASLQ
jgi:hypothetical protein